MKETYFISDGQEQQSMKEILATLARKSSDELPSYEDVTAEDGANNEKSSLSTDRPTLRFNPNAVVGKATCIQLKPAGKGQSIKAL